MTIEAAFDQLYESYFGDDHLEKGEVESLPVILQGCELFLDVGASLGMYTYHANRILSGAEIIAVEADPDRFAELSRNCKKWSQEGRNSIRAIHAIAAESAGRHTFYKTGSTISGGVFQVEERSSDWTPVDVEQVALDGFYAPGKKTVAKIDVEGAELRVLQGAERMLASREVDFLIELHWWGDRERGTTSLDVLKLLYDRGMAMVQPAPEHRSHYLFRPGAFGELRLPAYAVYSPSVVAKAMYGKYAPKPVRDLREKLTRMRRRKMFGGTKAGRVRVQD